MVLGTPATTAETRDARGAGVAPARGEDGRDGVDVRVVEEKACRFRGGEGRWCSVHAGYLDNIRVEWNRMDGRAGCERASGAKARKGGLSEAGRVRAISRA